MVALWISATLMRSKTALVSYLVISERDNILTCISVLECRSVRRKSTIHNWNQALVETLGRTELIRILHAIEVAVARELRILASTGILQPGIIFAGCSAGDNVDRNDLVPAQRC
jgi:hypothetical protein